MTKLQMRRVLKRHRGELTQLAHRAGVRQSTVAKWFTMPYKSKNIETHVTTRVAELLASEQNQESVSISLLSMAKPSAGKKKSGATDSKVLCNE